MIPLWAVPMKMVRFLWFIKNAQCYDVVAFRPKVKNNHQLPAFNSSLFCLRVRPLFCGESEMDQLGKIFEWVTNTFSHINPTDHSRNSFVTETYTSFQGYRLAARGGVANWCYTIKEKLPHSHGSPNHGLCPRDKWAWGATVAGKARELNH